ncbi:MAG: LCP family protein, partial [Coriobacteriia bacterium]|nr:LCP family protein [Coriobacteriia bacterium]
SAAQQPAAPAAPSARELNDVDRYRRMRRDAEDRNPLRRAQHAASDLAGRAGSSSGVGESLRESGEYRRGLGALIPGKKGPEAASRSQRRRPRRGNPAKTAKRVAIGVLAVILAFSVLLTVRMGAGISLETRLALSPALPGQPFYMLLVGTDKSEERVEDGSTGGTFRTDSIILARVDPIAARLTLVSIQRDTLVDLGGTYGKQKINAAYTYGGAPLLISAVSDLAGVKISHYAEIDFDSFTSVVDDLGGIDVNVPIDIDDDLADVHLAAGEQTINGADALGLCRARHAYDQYGSGDYYRTSNQRMVLGAILKKALGGNPLMLAATLNTASESVSTDLTGLELMFLGARFVGFDMSENLYSGLEPTGGVYENGVWYEQVDEAAWKTMMSRVDQGLSPYADESEDPTAGLAGITD